MFSQQDIRDYDCDCFIYNVSLLRRLFVHNIDLLSSAPISTSVPFIENNRLATLVKANGFSRGASYSKHCKSLKERMSNGGFVNLYIQMLPHIYACVCVCVSKRDIKSEKGDGGRGREMQFVTPLTHIDWDAIGSSSPWECVIQHCCYLRQQ